SSAPGSGSMAANPVAAPPGERAMSRNDRGERSRTSWMTGRAAASPGTSPAPSRTAVASAQLWAAAATWSLSLVASMGPTGASLTAVQRRLKPAARIDVGGRGGHYVTVSDGAGARLRAEMVAHLTERGGLSSPQVASALAEIPRHVFVPGVEL